MTIRDQLQAALAAYNGGDLQAALDALRAVPDRSEDKLEASLEKTASDPYSHASITGAIESYMSLARDRIRAELGEDVIAVCPVPLALNSALSLLGPARSVPAAPSHVVLSVRLPDRIHAVLRLIADAHHRSLAGEIVTALDRWCVDHSADVPAPG